MTHHRARSRRRENGVAAVEFALVAPLLVTCVFGVVEGGTRYTNQSQATHYAAVLARDVAIDPTKAATATSILTALKASNRDTRTYTVAFSPTPVCSPSTQVTVTVTTRVASPSGIFGTYTVRGVGVARCET